MLSGFLSLLMKPLTYRALSLSIRWVSKNYEVHEDVLDVKELPDTRAVTTHHEVNDILVRCIAEVIKKTITYV